MVETYKLVNESGIIARALEEHPLYDPVETLDTVISGAAAEEGDAASSFAPDTLAVLTSQQVRELRSSELSLETLARLASGVIAEQSDRPELMAMVRVAALSEIVEPTIEEPLQTIEQKPNLSARTRAANFLRKIAAPLIGRFGSENDDTLPETSPESEAGPLEVLVNGEVETLDDTITNPSLYFSAVLPTILERFHNRAVVKDLPSTFYDVRNQQMTVISSVDYIASELDPTHKRPVEGMRLAIWRDIDTGENTKVCVQLPLPEQLSVEATKVNRNYQVGSLKAYDATRADTGIIVIPLDGSEIQYVISNRGRERECTTDNAVIGPAALLHAAMVGLGISFGEHASPVAADTASLAREYAADESNQGYKQRSMGELAGLAIRG